EEGNDLFEVVGESSSTDLFDGGAGTDTLKINGTVDLSGATLASIERLVGNDNYLTITADQLRTVESATGVIFSGSDQDLSGVSGNFTLVGTSGNDTIIGGDGNNLIRPMAGTNVVDAGAGNDTLVWQSSWYQSDWSDGYYADRFVGQWDLDGVYPTITIAGTYDGGANDDTLLFDPTQNFYTPNYDSISQVPTFKYAVDLTGATVENFETLQVKSATFVTNGITGSYAPAAFYVTAAQLSDASTLSGGNFVVKGGGVVDLSALALIDGAKLAFAGDEAFDISGRAGVDTIITFGGNDTIVTGAGNDNISAGGGVDSIDAGAGDDLITLSGKSNVLDVIDGGSGVNTLRVTGADVDLSAASLLNIQKIEANSSSLALTQAQYDTYKLNLTGSAGLVLKMTTAGTANVASLPSGFVGIRGTEGADTLQGGVAADVLVGDGGDDQITGAGGNDSISGGAGRDAIYGGSGDDLLISGSGTDALYGGDGSDELRVTDKLVVSDFLSGGAGVDVLTVTDGQDLSLANIVDIEILKGTGTVQLTALQVAGFEALNGLKVQLV
ncbi:calcium-binding protein, partial [Shewanella sp.]|uniref:calcium-binding protein n=1 Tax=Shewanella sp. TaxID=50422 RepID=UPI004048B606